MKILLFGGNGTLGKELRKLDQEIIWPSKAEVNINDAGRLSNYVSRIKPDIIINAAAEIDNRKIEESPNQAIITNIIGAANLSVICQYLNIKLVYISTDYVYKGDKGNYSEESELLPVNQYAWTKLGGECSVKCVKNHLIIRVSFGPGIFPYKQAFINKKTSKDYVDIIAPMILKASKSDLTGVINIGTEAKTMYQYANKRNNVEGTFGDNSDHSLDLTKWKNYNETK